MEVSRSGGNKERIACLRVRAAGLRRAQAVEEGRGPACFVAEAEIEVRAGRRGVARNDRIDDLRTVEHVAGPGVVWFVREAAAPRGRRIPDDRAVDDLHGSPGVRFETDAAGVHAGIGPDQAVRHRAAASMDADASDIGTAGPFIVIDHAMRHDGARALQRHARRSVVRVVGGQRLAARDTRLREQTRLNPGAGSGIVEGRGRRYVRDGHVLDARVRMVDDKRRRKRR